MIVLLIGPPGAGKGTQAKRLCAERGMAHLSTGDMLRDARSSGTEMGQRVAEVMARGALVTDEIVIGLIAERLETLGDGGVIFDGFPRTLAQADALAALLSARGTQIAHVIELAVDDEALVARISGRFSCQSCGAVYHDISRKPKQAGICDDCGGTSFLRREDDSETALRSRLMSYYKQTSPLLGYYHAQGNLRRIDGMGGMDDVASAISGIIDS